MLKVEALFQIDGSEYWTSYWMEKPDDIVISDDGKVVDLESVKIELLSFFQSFSYKVISVVYDEDLSYTRTVVDDVDDEVSAYLSSLTPFDWYERTTISVRKGCTCDDCRRAREEETF
jgi:hypothetical protein